MGTGLYGASGDGEVLEVGYEACGNRRKGSEESEGGTHDCGCGLVAWWLDGLKERGSGESVG